MAFLVVERTQEIGIRMALGATRAGIVRMVLSHAARWTVAGCAVGLAGSLVLTRVLKSLLFEAPRQDAGALAAALGTLVTVTLLAAWMPSRRAAGVDPMEALRHE
jgi:ABC-type antimicrobial peptide transport system permease subunit